MSRTRFWLVFALGVAAYLAVCAVTPVTLDALAGRAPGEVVKDLGHVAFLGKF